MLFFSKTLNNLSDTDNFVTLSYCRETLIKEQTDAVFNTRLFKTILQWPETSDLCN